MNSKYLKVSILCQYVVAVPTGSDATLLSPIHNAYRDLLMQTVTEEQLDKVLDEKGLTERYEMFASQYQKKL